MDVDKEFVRQKVDACLAEKDYLIILDDIWKKKDLVELTKAFPESQQKKCRILVTARKQNVGGLAKYPLNLRPLNEEESMELFLKKVYLYAQDEIQSVSEGKKQWAREILLKCKRLPLEIVILGGKLQSESKRNDPQAWRRLSERVHSKLEHSRKMVDIRRKVIALSYIELPYDLRSCFLYLGLFPEDSMIDCDKLIRLWSAEGFLEQQGDNHEPMEDVAERCLRRLMKRSMIQVVEYKSNGTEPQTCCTHDVILHFAKQEAKRTRFSSIFKQQPLPSVEGIRRIALHPSTSTVPLQSKALTLSHSQSSFQWSKKSSHDVERQILSRKRARVGDEDDLVGFQEQVNELVSSLKNEEPLGTLAVLPIVGLRGIGKTAVAQKVYDIVKPHFTFSAWVNVPSVLSRIKKGLWNMTDSEHVLWSILEQVTSLTDAEMKREEESKKMLHDLLEEKNYLIVLDNLGSDIDWNDIEGIFPKPLKDQKCRVLLTIREPRITDPDRPIHCVKLRHLDDDLSLTLFLKTVSKHSQYEIIQEATISKKMRDIAREMVVDYCGNLPCAIVALGSLLSEKAIDDSVWNNTLENLKNVEWQHAGVNKVFLVCFLGLPDHLKPCILSFLCFPIDHVVQSNTLVKQWDDEELLKSENNQTIEDVARDYLQVFVQRKLVDVVKAGRTNDRQDTQTYIMQSAFHKFLQTTFSSTNNLSMLAGDSCPPSYAPPRSQLKTFSLSNSLSSLHPSKFFKFPNHVHSFLCFSKANLQFDFKQFPLLRILDLEGAEKMEEVPNEIRNLTLLRYLSLRGTRVKLIPTWIADGLPNLQTLDAPTSKIPIEALKLRQLRYLFADSFYGPPSARDHRRSTKEESSSSSTRLLVNIGVLEHLHTLELDTADSMISGLDNLTNLRVLRLCCGEDSVFLRLNGNEDHDVFGAVAMLTHLKSLYLSLKQGIDAGNPQWNHGGFESDHMHAIQYSSFSNLDEMILRGTIVELPRLDDFPRFLKYLWLETHLDNYVDPFSSLQHLPALKKLCLRLFTGEFVFKLPEMTCFTEGFAELEYLYVSVDFRKCPIRPTLSWTVEQGALRNLKVLHIEGNRWFAELPFGLRHVTTLKELFITRCYNLRHNLIHRTGRDWEEVKDIQSLSIKYLNNSCVKP